MRPFQPLTSLFAAVLLAGATASASAPSTWDGLIQVKSKQFDLVYLQPGADFRGYTKVLVDPTEVAFHKDWQKDYNRSSRMLSSRVSDSDMQQALSKSVEAAGDIFVQAWTKGGYSVVETPGPDVLRVRTGILNIWINAPERPTAGRSFSFAPEAGRATLFVEVRDSVTGALLGRAIDQKIVGDTMTSWRTSGTNRSDFRGQVEEWAKASVRGMTALKSHSVVAP